VVAAMPSQAGKSPGYFPDFLLINAAVCLSAGFAAPVNVRSISICEQELLICH
jgi:hypothetical protein